jgi:hypothetical protein
LALLIGWLSPSAGLKVSDVYQVESVLGSMSLAFNRAPTVSANEVRSFQSSVCGGSFYDELASVSGLQRGVVKHRFLVDVLAKRGRYPSEIEDFFRRAYPSVFGFIRWINRQDHGRLIRLLQRLEAWLVIEMIAPRLVGVVPIVTLHDAIFCRALDVGFVEAIFHEVMEEIGFCIQTKQEVWN